MTLSLSFLDIDRRYPGASVLWDRDVAGEGWEPVFVERDGVLWAVDAVDGCTLNWWQHRGCHCRVWCDGAWIDHMAWHKRSWALRDQLSLAASEAFGIPAEVINLTPGRSRPH